MLKDIRHKGSLYSDRLEEILEIRINSLELFTSSLHVCTSFVHSYVMCTIAPLALIFRPSDLQEDC